MNYLAFSCKDYITHRFRSIVFWRDKWLTAVLIPKDFRFRRNYLCNISFE